MKGIKAVYCSAFSGACTVKIIGKIDPDRDFFHRQNEFVCISTSRTNKVYKAGSIIHAPYRDLFDTYSVNRVGYFTYKGKNWHNNEFVLMGGTK